MIHQNKKSNLNHQRSQNKIKYKQRYQFRGLSKLLPILSSNHLLANIRMLLMYQEMLHLNPNNPSSLFRIKKRRNSIKILKNSMISGQH